MKTIKRTLTISAMILTGCTTYPSTQMVQVGPYRVAPGQAIPANITDIVAAPQSYVLDNVDALFTQPIGDLFVFADQANQLIGGIMGPNEVSGAILQGQNWYRTGSAILNNPWIGVSALRNQWVR